MEKRFIFEYTRNTVNATFKQEIKIVVEDGSRTDVQFPQLFVKLDAFRMRYDSHNASFITSIRCQDADTKLYDNASKASIDGILLRYERKSADKPGKWYGQYPANAYCCHGMYVSDIKAMCDHLRKKPDSQLIPGDNGFISDVLSMILFPDKVHNASQKVQIALTPEKEKAIKAIDDAMYAFDFLQNKAIENYINVPEQYLRCTRSLINRLSEAKLFIEQSVLPRRRR